MRFLLSNRFRVAMYWVSDSKGITSRRCSAVPGHYGTGFRSRTEQAASVGSPVMAQLPPSNRSGIIAEDGNGEQFMAQEERLSSEHRLAFDVAIRYSQSRKPVFMPLQPRHLNRHLIAGQGTGLVRADDRLIRSVPPPEDDGQQHAVRPSAGRRWPCRW